MNEDLPEMMKHVRSKKTKKKRVKKLMPSIDKVMKAQENIHFI